MKNNNRITLKALKKELDLIKAYKIHCSRRVPAQPMQG